MLSRMPPLMWRMLWACSTLQALALDTDNACSNKWSHVSVCDAFSQISPTITDAAQEQHCHNLRQLKRCRRSWRCGGHPWVVCHPSWWVVALALAMDGAITIDVTGLHSFLLALLAIGVPVLELIRIEPVLSIAGGLLTVGFCQRVRRLLLVMPSRGCLPSPNHIAAYEDLRAMAHARRMLHLNALTEHVVALAPLPLFRRHPKLLRCVVGFLVARCGVLDPDIARHIKSRAYGNAPVRYMCTAHGCRAIELDMIDFLDHVYEEHR
jgi:hypothetical protein